MIIGGISFHLQGAKLVILDKSADFAAIRAEFAKLPEV